MVKYTICHAYQTLTSFSLLELNILYTDRRARAQCKLAVYSVIDARRLIIKCIYCPWGYDVTDRSVQYNGLKCPIATYYVIRFLLTSISTPDSLQQKFLLILMRCRCRLLCNGGFNALVSLRKLDYD